MLEFAALIAMVVANGITSLVKPKKELSLTQEALDARKTLIRGINLVAVVVVSLLSYALIPGEQIDTASLTANLDGLFRIILTFGAGQGFYSLMKR